MSSAISQNQKSVLRPPVVVVLGHIDHGKSKLLDYIRKTSVVESEAGGITQHLSAYEVELKDSSNRQRKITFLDTPGHEAFQAMRQRGADVADLAILVVSAEEGVKTQTLEAQHAINEANIPFIVAINKIDKPEANVEKTKIGLAEHGIYLEGFGGQIPFAEISAKAGTGVDHLLELVLLVAELENWTGDAKKSAEGFVIEAHLDPQRGISATLVIKNGTLKKGDYITAGGACASTRILENFRGEIIEKATFSSPIHIVGWNKLPQIGATFKTWFTKREAEACANKARADETRPSNKKTVATAETATEENFTWIPLVIKSDTGGTSEALALEIEKIKTENAALKIIRQEVGAISETDVKAAGAGGLIVGFNVKTDSEAAAAAEQIGISIKNFDIIYKLTEWLHKELERRRPRQTVEEMSGEFKILKIFSQGHKRQIVGGKIITGLAKVGENFYVRRRTEVIGEGLILNLEKAKNKVGEVEAGVECGALVESKTEIVAGDVLEIFRMIEK